MPFRPIKTASRCCLQPAGWVEGGGAAPRGQGFLPPRTLAPAPSDVINSRIQAPSHDFGGCRAVARGDRLDDFQMKIAMPKAVFTRLHLAEGHVVASLPA